MTVQDKDGVIHALERMPNFAPGTRHWRCGITKCFESFESFGRGVYNRMEHSYEEVTCLMCLASS